MVEKVLVGYGIDVDAVSGWINTTNRAPADVTNISRGIFGATVGTERLLKMFDHYKVSAAPFVDFSVEGTEPSLLEGPRRTFDRVLQRRQDRRFQAADVEQRHPMPDLIYEYWSHQATDARDKVYALLSLAEERDKFEVDYAETASHLACRVTEFMYPEMSFDSAADIIKEIAKYLGTSCPV
ncbi:hypothetical protein LTR70_002562 [Exophiala xenobiotica]|uniref:Uncharacterized protein n=1 Tax=Lithohypha guttulata TaxID=1690604 RepID=A0ABR0KIS5_9EURO|nr:hypothetical protein LTR24_002261 [Lithohypha guttulata]KAK5325183.1 hypothetical protein LTR70_002562 [Exophiala xenobiotica]